jgi:hypothetical protein
MCCEPFSSSFVSLTVGILKDAKFAFKWNLLKGFAFKMANILVARLWGLSIMVLWGLIQFHIIKM